MEIYLSRSQGFCGGVSNAVKIVDQVLAKHGAPLYVFHEIVHNTAIVNDFHTRGVVFVEDINEIPLGETVIFSAHGVPPSIIKAAHERKLEIVDATCPLVKKVHREAVRFSRKKVPVFLIGHKKHQEIIGTSGFIDDDLLHIVEKEKDLDRLDVDPSRPVGYLTQTTLSQDETRMIIEKLKKVYKNCMDPFRGSICYATQQRQDAVKELSGICDIIIVCGSPNSSNSNRLRETAQKQGIESHIIDNADELDMGVLKNKEKVGISAGASVPKHIVDGLIKKIKARYPDPKIKNLKYSKTKYSAKAKKNGKTHN